ncbi:hypothetical protein [Paraflavitalea speifideaquila]|uniref:hypothetical protein n=1 Tax=Paraflavitalea speifideaquila TaxID=3076558 RepID=UPI0028E3859A|nr:hypothetical protein [Paraflavitalea speifideiaquila]
MPGEHYFLDVDASKLFMGNYQIDAFPTYALINKKALSSPPMPPGHPMDRSCTVSSKNYWGTISSVASGYRTETEA